MGQFPDLHTDKEDIFFIIFVVTDKKWREIVHVKYMFYPVQWAWIIYLEVCEGGNLTEGLRFFSFLEWLAIITASVFKFRIW